MQALREIDDDEPLDPSLMGGAVPVDWRMRRRLGRTTLAGDLRFVDITAPETHNALMWALTDLCVALGVATLDLSVVTSTQRRLTQEIARYIYELLDEHGEPRYAGVRYISRLNPEWECWAVFHDRMRHEAHPTATIFPDDPGLLKACRRLGIQPPAHGI